MTEMQLESEIKAREDAQSRLKLSETEISRLQDLIRRMRNP